jgi:hypothetical protein
MVHVSKPTVLYLKPVIGGCFHSGAGFASSEGEEEIKQALEALGCEARQMVGSVTWWFGLDVIEIIHFCNKVAK